MYRAVLFSSIQLLRTILWRLYFDGYFLLSKNLNWMPKNFCLLRIWTLWKQIRVSFIYYWSNVYGCFSDIKTLKLMQCEASTGHWVVRARKYQNFVLHKDAFYVVRDVPIDTDHLLCCQIPLHKVFETKLFKMNSITCNNTYEKFDFFIGRIRLVFILDLI